MLPNCFGNHESMNVKDCFIKYMRGSLSGLHPFGLTLGVLFFSASLTPSLLPRPTWIQAILSGLVLSLGYGLGILCVWTWRYLQLPIVTKRQSKFLNLGKIVTVLVLMAISVWYAASWQNSIRKRMDLQQLDSVQPVQLFVISIAIFVVFLTLSRLLLYMFQFASTKLERFLKPRAARVIGFLVCVWLVWATSQGIFLRMAMRTIDRSFQELDAMIDDDIPIPTNALQAGSAESLISWATLGNQGRQFVSGVTSSSALEAFFGRPCPEPIRVYVGLNSADTAEERASLALKELIRTGAFERSILLLVTPTGTGWVDPASQNPVEYLHRGDIATVAVQYSYLNSPLALLTDAEQGARMASILFDKIYGYWRTLPKDSRPRLFLHGLSLGSLNSDLSFQLFDIVDDPFDGALWSGPPFLHRTWRKATQQRDPGSPAWLPTVRNGSVIRFMNQQGSVTKSDEPWGSFRIAFLQNASDPITFFDPSSAWRKPDWMMEPRGVDLSDELRWFPVVTMLQLAVDMVVGSAPPGFGHSYAPKDYIHAWIELTEPNGWSDAEAERLVTLFDQTRSISDGAP
jgi:uncharacterized membrane protein